jgi:hypothetical protein
MFKKFLVAGVMIVAAGSVMAQGHSDEDQVQIHQCTVLASEYGDLATQRDNGVDPVYVFDNIVAETPETNDFSDTNVGHEVAQHVLDNIYAVYNHTEMTSNQIEEIVFSQCMGD